MRPSLKSTTTSKSGLVLHFSVGAVAAFVRRGDINARVSHQTTTMEGMIAHQALQKSRGPDYQKEKSVSTVCHQNGHQLTIAGRADGYHPAKEGRLPWIEEIKTTRLAPDQIPTGTSQLHWHQLRLYGHMICEAEQLSEVELRLTYVHPDSLKTAVITKTMTAENLQAEFTDLLRPILTWLEQRAHWLECRNQHIPTLKFPFDSFRPHQRDIAAAVYRNATAQGQLFLQAPTGLGKSIASLFPVLKSLPATNAEKVFYLSSKTAGQASAENVLRHMHQASKALRTITITAKRKTCFNPELPCDPEVCTYAKDYYESLPEALQEITQSSGHWSRERVEALAKTHDLCPFELSLDAAREMDIVVCDINNCFDPKVRLKRFFDDQKGRYPILVDEVHNLIDRAREMFSAEINQHALKVAADDIKTLAPVIFKSFSRVSRALTTLSRKSDQNEFEVLVPKSELKTFMRAVSNLLGDFDGALGLPPLPETAMTAFFLAHHFSQVFEQFNEDYCCVLTKPDGQISLRLVCLHPGLQLQQSYRLADSLVGFSATLSPRAYYQEMLGIPETATWFKSMSPFNTDHQLSLIVDYIPTRYEARIHGVERLVDLIETWTSAKPGNYLVYFPSYQFLQLAADQLLTLHPDYALICQKRGMSNDTVEDFLTRFQEDSQQLGFAVMGGQFSEGIDLKGKRLLGVMIITLGLAPKSKSQDALAEHLDGSLSDLGDSPSARGTPSRGYDYAYRFPAIQKIVQTGGRVIRSEEDRGVVVLVDARYKDRSYQAYFPVSWRTQTVSDKAAFHSKLVEFWSQQDA